MSESHLAPHTNVVFMMGSKLLLVAGGAQVG